MATTETSTPAEPPMIPTPTNGSSGELGPTLQEHADVWADALRAVAEGWRLRANAGRLGEHSPAGALQLAAAFDAAAQLLERGDAPGKGSVQGDEFRLLVESVTDYAIFLLDPEGRIR